ncbi:hypothetical protein T11_6830 [Trichinella zimbabwensis]|uniref:Uncharacterized protein n=1 Tax=Trichinella zimbabwensis TaxID=268475 RepID=A0A0V1I3B5_9BILA|nr:hypothetical protein T11_6830 [Trichinella zimbabwensis]
MASSGPMRFAAVDYLSSIQCQRLRRLLFFIPVVPCHSLFHLSYELRAFHHRHMKLWLRLSYAQN